ncbi:MAG: chloride channel protein [Planctomycetota bacterium]
MEFARNISGLKTRLRQWPGFMLVLALMIGLVGGLGAVGFRALIGSFEGLFWRDAADKVSAISQLPWYWIVAIPTLGAFVVGGLVHRFAKEAKGHGVPEVMEAVAIHGGRIRPRVVVVKPSPRRSRLHQEDLWAARDPLSRLAPHGDLPSASSWG